MIFASLREVGCRPTLSVHETPARLAATHVTSYRAGVAPNSWKCAEGGSTYAGETVRSTGWLTNTVNEAMSAVQCLNADSYLTGLGSEMPSRHGPVFCLRAHCAANSEVNNRVGKVLEQ
jgi:hypothetical protein